MTDIEKKALALVNEVTSDDEPWTLDDVRGGVVFKTLCRAIEQHEAFRQEVSEFALGVKGYMASVKAMAWQPDCDKFILPKPDPLVEAMQDWWDTDGYASIETFRAAIEARGGRIVWEGE